MERSPPNPIIPGFSPDPSVCLIGDTFYLANSSFHIFPGIPLYTSKDLISWKHIGNAINRPSQLSLRRADTTLHPGDNGNTIVATGGLYAPTIRHHNGVTYILCTNVIHKLGDSEGTTHNFIIHTKDIDSMNWSDPVIYDFQGIDPSILFDDDGKIWIQGTSHAFEIYNMEVDLETGKYIQEPKIIYKGWDKRYPEGPHVYKRGDWYYLLVAEGGTFNYHLASIARSKNIWGPYEPDPQNPTWTAWGKQNNIQHTGHADLFQDAKGGWWIVMLGVRWKDIDHYNMGRESFLSKVGWPADGWPVVEPVVPEISSEPSAKPTSEAVNGVDWIYLRDPGLKRFDIKNDGTVLVQATTPDLSSPNDTVSWVGKRQRKNVGSARVTLVASKTNTKTGYAGLSIYKDELRYLQVAYDFETGKVKFQGVNTVRKYSDEAIASVDAADEVSLRFDYDELAYRVYWKASGQDWTKMAEVDTAKLTNFDFTGPLVGMFAVGSDYTVEFKDFVVDATEA